jgi:3-hydroxyisobutyrate dehydrogenase-like beta-hydroxyacid dehydrogenase
MQQGTKIGFIGLGAMGSGMAASLCRTRFAVTGYDLRREATDRLAQLGGAGGGSSEEPRGAHCWHSGSLLAPIRRFSTR